MLGSWKLYIYTHWYIHTYTYNYIIHTCLVFLQTSQAKASPPARCAVATVSLWAPPWPWRWARCSQVGRRGFWPTGSLKWEVYSCQPDPKCVVYFVRYTSWNQLTLFLYRANCDHSFIWRLFVPRCQETVPQQNFHNDNDNTQLGGVRKSYRDSYKVNPVMICFRFGL